MTTPTTEQMLTELRQIAGRLRDLDALRTRRAELIVALYQSGLSRAAVAREAGVAPITVADALRNAGVQPRPVGRPRKEQ